MSGRRIDDSVPFADLRLPDGSRCHAVLSPVSRPGTTISLRVPPTRAFTLDELLAAGTVTPRGAELLRALVDARVAFLVSGGTGTGKTTLLAALLSLVDPRERMVLVEDASELRPDHPHVVALEGRPPNVEGVGAIDLPRAGALVGETVARCALLALVVRPTVTGVAAAARWVATLTDPSGAGLVVRGHGADPARVAALVGLPVLTAMSDQRGLPEALDLGLGPVRSRRGPLAAAARELLAATTPRAVAA
jgi:pilus assembly protein CpaF